ncbi:MAG: hypothetical protein BRD55_05980 [Bacteroidetes bacterium SW_9_63_38]|nr:MAG: hypothetical protein BRD55_05980 [Bacteroidetes bacterium SW_9_63_38]
MGTGLVVALLMGGCVQTALLPSGQLDGGETVVSANLDEPGFLYIPRLNLQVTQGLGGGDLTGNVAGTLGMVGGGLAGRYYLTDAVNVEGQVQVQSVCLSEETRQATVLLGGQQTTRPDDHLYLGGHAGGLYGEELLAVQNKRHAYPLVGGTIGVGHIDLGGAWRMQMELESSVPVTTGEWELVPPARVSIGVFRHWE